MDMHEDVESTYSHSELVDRIVAHLAAVYRELIENQVEVDPTIRKIIDDNLWELYERNE